jgi:hypothetical protein
MSKQFREAGDDIENEYLRTTKMAKVSNEVTLDNLLEEILIKILIHVPFPEPSN